MLDYVAITFTKFHAQQLEEFRAFISIANALRFTSPAIVFRCTFRVKLV